MARLPRVVVPGFPHHLTQRGVRSLPIFRHDADRAAYIALIKEHCATAGLDILAWCLMSNHVHFVVLPTRTDSLARGIGEAHRLYTRRINFSEGVRGHLFQERFHSCALDELHLVAAARYVEMNPVKAKLCARPEHWEWSSARFHLGKTPNDGLVKDRTLLGYVPVSQWPALYEGDSTVKDENLLRFVKTGRPAGDGVFQAKLEGLTGRQLVRGRPGPKAKT